MSDVLCAVGLDEPNQAVAGADRISVLVLCRVIASGTPSDIRENEEVQRAYLGDQHVVTRHG